MADALESKAVASSSLVTTTLMTPEMANFSGNIHGGHILRLVDQIAYACASRYSGKYCVTVSVDRVKFKVPVRVGDLLTMRARVNHVGRTSMEIGVRVEAQDLRGGEARHTNSCYVTMVAIEDDKPVAVPALVCETERDRRRHARAKLRREQYRALERIERSEKDYYDIVELASVAILLIDTESGKVRHANRQACTLLQRTAQDLGQLDVWHLHPEECQPEAHAFWETVKTSGFAETEALDHLTGDGRRVPIAVAAWLIPLPTGRLIQRVMRPRSDSS
ncbi:MAG: hotdog domain-containing protein [Acidobacteriota bacterium]